MTVNVHEDLANEYIEKGYREVTRWYYMHCEPEFSRVDFANPEDTCLHEMRGWSATFDHGRRVHHGYCLLDKGHKGRHSTVVFYCDVCQKTRRGEPSYSVEDVAICWFCRNVNWRGQQ